MSGQRVWWTTGSRGFGLFFFFFWLERASVVYDRIVRLRRYHWLYKLCFTNIDTLLISWLNSILWCKMIGMACERTYCGLLVYYVGIGWYRLWNEMKCTSSLAIIITYSQLDQILMNMQSIEVVFFSVDYALN